MKIAKSPEGINQEYQKDIDYKTAMGFYSKWPEITRFIEGDQWPPATEATKHMPRPVVNQMGQTVENKLSNILSQQLKMIFRPKDVPEEGEEYADIADGFSDMAEATWYDMEHDTLIEEMVNDAICIGNGILHYYYDNSIRGGTKLPYIGELRGESIDPMDICYGNNQLKPYQIQKQPWIIIKRRRDTEDVRAEAKKYGKDADKIESNDSVDTDAAYDTERIESENGHETITLTKYYKEKGEIYYTEVTANAIVKKPSKVASDIDGLEREPFRLYPIVHLGFKRRRKCVYYRSLVEDSIANQKALNFGLGMQLWSVQQTAWPKIIAKMGALVDEVTNIPGEILEDRYTGGGDGFKYMQMPNTPATAATITNTILDMTKSVTGTTDVSTGEQMGANMAAAAIIALQNQAQKPNAAYMQNVVRSVKQAGEIWENFYKSFYTTPRMMRSKDKDGKEISIPFNGEDGAGQEFDLIVDVGPSSVYSESLSISVLDAYADRQWIDKYTHAENMPKNVLNQSIREEFKKEKEEVKLQQEQQQIQQQMQQQQQAQQGEQLTPEEIAIIEANPQLMEGMI